MESRVRAGHLDRRLVRLLVEAGVVALDEATGEGEFTEKGNRTTYFQDLLDIGCPIHVWPDYDHLQFTLRQLAGTLQN